MSACRGRPEVIGAQSECRDCPEADIGVSVEEGEHLAPETRLLISRRPQPNKDTIQRRYESNFESICALLAHSLNTRHLLSS
jgi:hypothetical protein